jgi:hypothetical protein
VAFKYRARSDAQWERRSHAQSDYAGILLQDFKEYRAKSGDNYVRILPPTWENPTHYGLELYIHYSVGPEQTQVLCPARMKNQPCPICEAYAKAKKAGDDDLAGELRPRQRWLVWMIDLKDEEQGPQLWSMPTTLDADIVNISKDKRTGQWLTIDHPTDGYGVSFTKEGEGIATRYRTPQIDRNSSSVDADILEFIEATPLPNVLLWRDYAELKRLFQGGEEEEEPKAPQPKPAPAREAQRPARPTLTPKEEQSLEADAEVLHTIGDAKPIQGNGEAQPPAPATAARSRADELRQRFARK